MKRVMEARVNCHQEEQVVEQYDCENCSIDHLGPECLSRQRKDGNVLMAKKKAMPKLEHPEIRVIYPGPCLVCGRHIPAGEKALWEKGVGIKHKSCTNLDKSFVELPRRGGKSKALKEHITEYDYAVGMASAFLVFYPRGMPVHESTKKVEDTDLEADL